MSRNLIVLIVVVVIVGAGLFLLLSRGGSSSASTVQAITPADYVAQFETANTPYMLLDVRTPDEFNSGHIAGAVNISVETLGNRLAEVPQGQPVIVYCRSGNRSKQASQILADAGYTNIHDMGGIIAWVDAGYPIE